MEGITRGAPVAVPHCAVVHPPPQLKVSGPPIAPPTTVCPTKSHAYSDTVKVPPPPPAFFL